MFISKKTLEKVKSENILRLAKYLNVLTKNKDIDTLITEIYIIMNWDI